MYSRTSPKYREFEDAEGVKRAVVWSHITSMSKQLTTGQLLDLNNAENRRFCEEISQAFRNEGPYEEHYVPSIEPRRLVVMLGHKLNLLAVTISISDPPQTLAQFTGQVFTRFGLNATNTPLRSSVGTSSPLQSNLATSSPLRVLVADVDVRGRDDGGEEDDEDLCHHLLHEDPPLGRRA